MQKKASIPLEEKTARELSKELGKLGVAAGAANNYTPSVFRSMILGMLISGDIKLEHIVALGMGSALNPIAPGGPAFVLDCFANTIQFRVNELKEKTHESR